MKKRLFPRILNDCHQATVLIIKREDAKLNFLELARLHYHLLYCSICRNFAHQSRLINDAMNRIKLTIENKPSFILSDRVKTAVRQNLRDAGTSV